MSILFAKLIFWKKIGFDFLADWKICKNGEKLDYQGAEGKSFFQLFK